MKVYSYLKKLRVTIHKAKRTDFVEAEEMNQKVQMLLIKNSEMLHALRQIKSITVDYNYKTRLQDVLKVIHEVAKKNLAMFGEEADK